MRIILLLTLVSCNSYMAIDDETLLKLKNNSDSEICTKVYEPKETAGKYCIYFKESI